jgi:hypothetical protein
LNGTCDNTGLSQPRGSPQPETCAWTAQGESVRVGLGNHTTQCSVLRRALLEAASWAEVTEGDKDDYGQRYVLDREVAGPAGNALVRSRLIFLGGEDFPRLISCYVL